MFVLKIKELRMSQNLSQDEFSERVGISQMYVSYLERTHRKKSPTLRIIEQIADTFGICPLDLLECQCDKCKETK